MCIKRFLSSENLNRMQKDLGFLVERIVESNGELDLAIRDNYFNVYYKGNSLAKVTFKPNELYEISIHRKFFDSTDAASDYRFKHFLKNNYAILTIENSLLPAFFQQKYIKQFASNVKKINYGEELTLEQAIITDNLNRKDLIIIDRQVTDTKLDRKRMDLLALKEYELGVYQFVILEVKRGDNKDLKGEVVNQLKLYSSHLQKHFNSYKECYEKQYQQKKELGLYPVEFPDKINIISNIEEWVIIVGYSGIGKNYIEYINNQYPHINVKQLTYKI